MIDVFIAFCFGVIVGGWIGFFIAALIVMAHRGDDD